jgi:hypothetical protein
MHRTANPMPDIFPHNAETVTFDIILDSPRDIYNPIPRLCLRYAFVKGLFGNIHQLLSQDATSTHGYRLGIIANETIVNDSNIKAYDIAELQDSRPSQAVNHLFVDGYADIRGKFASPPGISAVDVSQKRTFCPIMLHSRGCVLVNVPCGDAWLDKSGDFVKYGAGDGTSRPHGFQIPLGFEVFTQCNEPP